MEKECAMRQWLKVRKLEKINIYRGEMKMKERKGGRERERLLVEY